MHRICNSVYPSIYLTLTKKRGFAVKGSTWHLLRHKVEDDRMKGQQTTINCSSGNSTRLAQYFWVP